MSPLKIIKENVLFRIFSSTVISIFLYQNMIWVNLNLNSYDEGDQVKQNSLASKTIAGNTLTDFYLDVVSRIIADSPDDFIHKVEEYFKRLSVSFEWIFAEKMDGSIFLVFRIGENTYLKKMADNTLEDISSSSAWQELLFKLLDLVDEDYKDAKPLNYDLTFNPNYNLSKDRFIGLSIADWDKKMGKNVYWSTYDDDDKRELIKRIENLRHVPKIISRLVTKYIHDKYGPDQEVKIIGMWVNGSSIYKRSTKDRAGDLDCVVILEGKGMRDIIFQPPETVESAGINIEGMVFDSSDHIKIGETNPHTHAAIYSAIREGVCLIGSCVIEGDVSRRSHLMSIKKLCENGLKHLVRGPRYYRKWNNRFVVIKSILCHLGIIKTFDHLKYWKRNDEMEVAINNGDNVSLKNFLEQFIREYEETLEIVNKELEETKKDERADLVRIVLNLEEDQRGRFIEEEMGKRERLISKYKGMHEEQESRQVWMSYLKKANDADCDEDTHLRIIGTGDENLILTVAQNTKYQSVLRRIYEMLSPKSVLYKSILYQLARNVCSPPDIINNISRLQISNNEYIIREIASNLNTPDETLDRLISAYSGDIKEKASNAKRMRDILKRLGISIHTDYKKYEGRKDLHAHSVFSDGYFTPEELIIGAKFLGLDTVAITDHMSISGIEEIQKYGAVYNVNAVGGIGFNAHLYVEGKRAHFHILGYDVDINNQELIERLEEYRCRDNERARIIGERINSLINDRYRFSFDEILEASVSKHIAGKDILNILRKKGAGDDTIEIARRCLVSAQKEDCADYVEKVEFDSPEEVIKLIARAGGRAVLAHPGIFISAIKRNIAEYFTGGNDELNEVAWEKFTEMLESSFIPAGLKGIEVYYSEHDFETVKRLKELAEKYSLEIGYGSDFHGDPYQDRKLGETDTAKRRETKEIMERFSQNQDLHQAYLAWHMLLRYGNIAEEYFIDLLKIGDSFTKMFSVIGLGKIGSRKAVPYLRKVLQMRGESGGFDISEALRQYASEALGEIGGEEAVDILIDKLAERRTYKTGENIGSSPVAYNARVALVKIGNIEEFKDRVAIKSIIGIRSSLKDRLSTRRGWEDKEILKARHLVLILGSLDNDRIDKRKILTEILEKYNDKNFTNQDEVIWANTISVLGDLGSSINAVDSLVASYKNPRAPPLVKVRAIEALGDIGGLKAKKFLRKIKPDEDSGTESERIVLQKALHRALEYTERRGAGGLNIFHASFHGLYDEKLKGLGGRDGGGQITYLVELVSALGGIIPHDVDTITALSRGVVFDETLNMDIPDVDYTEMVQSLGPKAEIVRIPFGPKRFVSRSELWQYADAFNRNYNRYIKKRGILPDVIHIHSADGATVEMAKNAKENGIPVVFTIHAGGLVKLKALTEDSSGRSREVFETIRQPAELISRILGEEHLLKLADRVVVSTQGEIDEQWSLYAGMSEINRDRKFRVIPPGIKIDAFCPSKDLDLEQCRRFENAKIKLITEIQKQISEENRGKPH